MDIKKIAYFLEIVKYKSIKKTAEKMGLNQSVLSKSLKSMEEELGCQLYIHYDKKFQLTHAGEFVSKYFQRFIAVHEGLKNELAGLRKNPQGKLNVVSSSGFIHFIALPILPDFLKNNKNIFLSFKTDDLTQNLEVNNEVCIGPKIIEPGVISIYLYSYWLKMYANKSYLEENGYPEKPEDLDNHNLIAYSQDLQSNMMDFDWHLRYGASNGVPRTPTLEVTSSYALKKMAEMDLGIITFSEFLIDRESSNLVNIFPQEGVRVNCYFSYRAEHETFWPLVFYRDYLINYFSQTSAFDPTQVSK